MLSQMGGIFDIPVSPLSLGKIKVSGSSRR